jgi:hypothetical protein
MYSVRLEPYAEIIQEDFVLRYLAVYHPGRLYLPPVPALLISRPIYLPHPPSMHDCQHPQRRPSRRRSSTPRAECEFPFVVLHPCLPRPCSCNLLALPLARLLRQPNTRPRITIPKNSAAGDRVRRCNTPRASPPPNTLLDNGSSIAGASNGAMASHRRRRPATRHGRRQRVEHRSPPREAHVKASGRSQGEFFLSL